MQLQSWPYLEILLYVLICIFAAYGTIELIFYIGSRYLRLRGARIAVIAGVAIGTLLLFGLLEMDIRKQLIILCCLLVAWFIIKLIKK